MRTFKVPAFSIVLYVLSGLLMLYAAWAAYHSYSHISEMIEHNQLQVKGNVYNIINFYMSNCSQYFLFAIILLALGWMLQRNMTGKPGRSDASNRKASFNVRPEDRIDDEEFEEWFRKNEGV